MKQSIVFSGILCCLLTGCMKEEIPVKKPLSTANTVQVSMGADYANQLFYDIETQSILLQNNREIWDLAFESSQEGFHVTMNSSKLMGLMLTDETELAQVNTSTGYVTTWDNPTGNPDETAMGDWRTHDFVYILDRGTSLTGTALGKIKLKMLAYTASSFTFEWASLTASTTQITVLSKEEGSNFTYFSFDNGGATIHVEPDPAVWDLCFTTYTHVFDAETPYLVSGVLTNRSLVRVAKSTIPFEELNYANAQELEWSSDRNVIGYDWKTYDFDAGNYVVDPTKVYAVQTTENRLFKIRFVDFYTDSGVKGAPRFEIQELIP